MRGLGIFGAIAVVGAFAGLCAGIGITIISIMVWPPAVLILVAFGLWIAWLIRKDRREKAMEQRIEAKLDPKPKVKKGEWIEDPNLPSALD